MVDSIFDVLRKSRRSQVMAIMPPQTGKTAVLLELLDNLSRLKYFRRCLILVNTISELEQLRFRFKDYGLSVSDRRDIYDKNLSKSEIFIETAGNFTRACRKNENEFSRWHNLFDCSHVILTALSRKRRADLDALASADNPPSIIVISSPIVLGPYDSLVLPNGSRKNAFHPILFRYTIDEALEEGVLMRADLIDKSRLNDSRLGAYVIGENGLEGFRSAAVSDFVMEIGRLGETERALLVVSTKMVAEQVADLLANPTFASDQREDLKSRRVITITSAREAQYLERYIAEQLGSVVITTSPYLSSAMIRDKSLIGVISALSPDKAIQLRYPPSRPVHSSSKRVLDYFGDVVNARI